MCLSCINAVQFEIIQKTAEINRALDRVQRQAMSNEPVVIIDSMSALSERLRNQVVSDSLPANRRSRRRLTPKTMITKERR
jgi:hypothetical protein